MSGWVAACAMGIGALFGPWATLFDHTGFRQGAVYGTDGGNHGWLVLSVALLGAVAFAGYAYLPAARVWTAALAVVAGAVAVGVTVHDRLGVEHAFGGTRWGIVQVLQSFVHVGWGLNVALGASAIVAVAGVALLLTDRLAEGTSTPNG